MRKSPNNGKDPKNGMAQNKGKNIVVFSDGTGQDGGSGHNTNVYKTFNLILDRSADQISFYDPGLGTGFRKFTGNVKKDRQGIRDALAQIKEFDGITGKMTFTEEGDPIKCAVIVKISDAGEYEFYKSVCP